MLMPKDWDLAIRDMRKITFGLPDLHSGDGSIPDTCSLSAGQTVVPRIAVYTDASLMNSKAGAASIIHFDGKEVLSDQLHLGPAFTSQQAEYWAVVLAMLRLKSLFDSPLWKPVLQREGDHTVDLFVDLESAVKILLQPGSAKSDEPVIKLLRRYKRRLKQSYPLVKFNVHRIGSREGGNRLAHHKARGAAGEGGTNIATSIL